MSENKHLTPVWIIYVDGRRLDLEHDGALRSITITDRLNDVSGFSIVFETGEVKIKEKGIISTGSEVSIHLGYKDDINEVFSGEALTFRGIYPEAGTEQLRVSGQSVLGKLKHASHFRSFEQKAPSDVIRGLIDSYSLKPELDDFGTPKLFQSEENLTDFDYLMAQAAAYGKQVYATGSTIYVNDEISIRSDEIIYEWGKSLVSLEAIQDMGRLLSGVDYIGWDHLKNESFAGKATLNDMPVKIGGPRDWSEVYKGNSGKFVDTGVDLYCKDSDEAKQLAIGQLQNNSYSFGYAYGKGEGNYKLRPGMRVTVKMVDESLEGEYMAQTVTHHFNHLNGYTAEFTLKRNMCP